MALIKNAQAGRVVRDAVVLDLGDLQREAARMVDRARREAESVLTDAHSQARALVDAADARGYEDGLQRGHEEGVNIGRREGREEALAQFSARIEALLKIWEVALQQWEHDRAAMVAAAHEDVLAFACGVAQRVVHRLPKLDHTIVLDQLAQALGLLTRPATVTVSINAADREEVQSMLPKLLEQFNNCQHVKLVDDPAMARGGCVVATAGGRIDASIETQIDRIIDVLLPDAQQRLEARLEPAGTTPDAAPAAESPAAPQSSAPSASSPAEAPPSAPDSSEPGPVADGLPEEPSPS